MPELKQILQQNQLNDKEIAFAIEVTKKIFEARIKTHHGLTTEAILGMFLEDRIPYHEIFIKTTLEKLSKIKEPVQIMINVNSEWYTPHVLS